MALLTEERAAGSARTRVYAALRDAILDARFAPGRKLSENELAGQFDVSRTPIREVLAALRDERLVEVVPQVGTLVTRISDEGVRDAAFVREALECAAVRLAAERARPDDVVRLRGDLDAQQRAVDAGDHRLFDRLDDELHQRLCAVSGRAIAWDLSRRANGHLARVRRLSLPDPDYLEAMVAEHRTVVDAVAEGDADRAEESLRHHLRMVLSALPALRASRPEYFADPDPEG
ncbi:MAG: GntR family transcriptional regulator [Solirubrobacteraceae bacterium]